MAYATSKPNPLPALITDASWWFMDQLLKLERDTEDSGIYGNKPGYHGTRAENDARSGVGKDYSCRAPLDRLGPSDKAAGYDWTFHSAQRGDYSRMALYGARLLVAFDARDPRLLGWREALGQTDRDKAAEGLDFQGWFKRVPDSTHEWHWHFSELRAYVESYINKEALLSVLSGETLTAYLARGGLLIGDDMALTDKEAQALIWRVEGLVHGRTAVANGPLKGEPIEANLKAAAQDAAIAALAAKVGVDAGELEAIKAAAREGAREALTPEALAAAIPDELAAEVADLLAARLAA